MLAKLVFIFVLLFVSFATDTCYAGQVISCSSFESCPDGTEWFCASPGSDGSCVTVSCGDITPITALSMVWSGVSGVDIVTEVGQQFHNVQNGNQITFDTEGAGNDVELTLNGGVNGSSRFHISCSDQEMNGAEDCGNNQGDGKGNDSFLNNQWLLDGMAGDNSSFDCELPNTGVVDPSDLRSTN